MSEQQCPYCGASHPGAAAFCPSTGQRLQPQGSVAPAPAAAWAPPPARGAVHAPVAGHPSGVAPPQGPVGYPQGGAPGYGQIAPGGYPQGGVPGYGQPTPGGYPQGGASGYAQPVPGGYPQGGAPGYGQVPQAPYAQPGPAGHAAPSPAYAPPPLAAYPGQYAQGAAPAFGGVRHAYPLTIRDASLTTAVGLMMKTLPYALARFGVLFAVSIATLIWYVVAFGGWAMGARIHPAVGFVWFLVCCTVYGWLWTLVVRYFLYLLKCGHIAVLTELMTRGSLNLQGKGMFAYGKDVVRSRFGEVTVLFVVDKLVSGVVRTFNRTLDFVANLLPIPGLSSVVSVVNSVLYAATTYLDETIFSYGLARNETNPWVSAKDGLIYYAQNSKEILKTALWIVVLDKVFTAIVWAIMLVPAFIVTWIMPSSVVSLGGWFAFGFAAILAANVRSAFIKPIFLVMIMSKFHVQIENQPLNAEWDARLSGISDKFRELEAKARGYKPTPALAHAV